MEVNGLEVIDNLPQGLFQISFCDSNSKNNDNFANLSSIVNEVLSPIKIANIFPSYDIQMDLVRYSYDALISGLQIASQLARHSEEHYAILYKVFTAKKLATILTCSHSLIRAKGCNLIGNLCRYDIPFPF